MTNIQSSRAIAVALMVVLTLMALALPVAGQELTPVLTVTYTDGSTTETPGTPTGGDTWHFNVTHTGIVDSAEVAMPDGVVIEWGGQGSNLVDPCGPGGGQGIWHWVLTPSAVLTISDATCTPLGVVLADFSAVCQVDEIVITWETGSEINNVGFNLIRGVEGLGTTVEIWFIPSQSPGGTSGASYTFVDSTAVVGVSYAYSLESVDVNGTTVRYGPVIANCEPPTAVTVSNLTATTSPRAPMPWCLTAAVLSVGGMFIVFRRKRKNRSTF